MSSVPVSITAPHFTSDPRPVVEAARRTETYAAMKLEIDSGRVVHAGPAAELLRDPTRIKALLGVSGGAH